MTQGTRRSTAAVKKRKMETKRIMKRSAERGGGAGACGEAPLQVEVRRVEMAVRTDSTAGRWTGSRASGGMTAEGG